MNKTTELQEMMKEREERKRLEKEARKRKWHDDLVHRMTTDNPMFDPVNKTYISVKMKGNKNAKKGVVRNENKRKKRPGLGNNHGQAAEQLQTEPTVG